MSEQVTQNTVQEQTQKLIDGPLKHIRAAALAAALLPLASFAATPASAQNFCGSGGVCGTVFSDTNGNGIQDAGESGIEGVKVVICQVCDGTDNIETETAPEGFYLVYLSGGPYTVSALIPTDTAASPPNVGDDAFDSDGAPIGAFSVVTDVTPGDVRNDFGFVPKQVESPGTGTPGYWKNHPEAWPVSSITVGGVLYTKDEAIAWLAKVSKDKTTTMFSSLVPAMLNRLIGNNSSCVDATITAANNWMATYGPVGSGVLASSPAWALGEPLHKTLDAYNNGLLCAPHRQ
jgi:SdrD B-like domain